MKRILLVLAGVMLLAACMPVQANTPAAPATEVTPLVIQTPVPPASSPTPEICAPGWTAIEGECTRPFFAPIPEDFTLNGIASPDDFIFPVGESGTVYAVMIELAKNGVSMPEGITMVLNMGTKNGESQFGMIETLGESEFRYDGGGIAVLGNYHPVKSLDRWYDTANPQLADEIKILVEHINAKHLCAAPNTNPSPAYLCRPFPPGYRFATPTP